MRKNNNEVDSFKTGLIVFVELLYEKCMYITFLINDDNVILPLLNL